MAKTALQRHPNIRVYATRKDRRGQFPLSKEQALTLCMALNATAVGQLEYRIKEINPMGIHQQRWIILEDCYFKGKVRHTGYHVAPRETAANFGIEL